MNGTKNIARDSYFTMFTVIVVIVLIAIISFAVNHKSSVPTIIGRYSMAYTIFLSCLVCAVSFLLYNLIHPVPSVTRLIKNIYTLSVSAIIVILFAEIGLRVINPWGIEFFHLMPYHMQGMVDDDQLGYVHPKSVTYSLGSNTVKLNSHGLRGEDVQFIKPEGDKRILMLGDSVMFGWGVDENETTSFKIEKLLNNESKNAWKVINAGVNGYNTSQEALYFSTKGKRYVPDIVVLIYVNNDVEPALDPNTSTWRRYPAMPDSLPEVLNRIRQMSYLYQVTRINLRMNSVKSKSQASSIIDHPRWEQSKKALGDIKYQSDSIGAKLLIAHTSSPIDTAFHYEMKSLGIDSISLAKSWRRVPQELRHVSRLDPHPSEKVHNAFAVDIVDAFKKRRWINN